MINLNNISVSGIVCIKRYSHDMQPLGEIVVNNLITNNGLKFFVEKLLDIDTSQLYRIGIGNGRKAATLSDLDLALDTNQIGIVSHTKAYSNIRIRRLEQHTNQPKRLYVECLFGGGEYSNGNVNEVGLYTNKGNFPGTMVARVVLANEYVFNKADTDFLRVGWSIIFG